MVDGKPADYVPIIKANHARSHACLIARSGDCIEGWRLFASRGRQFARPIGIPPAGNVPPRTVVGLIVCPGDDLTPVMAWVAKHKIAPAERILIVHHPDCDMVKILAPWYKVFTASPLVLELTKWPGEKVHKRFGDWYNDWIYLDAVGRPWPL